MRRIAFYIAVITFPLALEAFADPSVNLLNVRLFRAEPDPVFDKLPAAVGFSYEDADKYIWDAMDYNRDVKELDEMNESRRNTLQWGKFRLMFSRYQESRSWGVSPRTMDQGDIQRMLKSLPSRLRNESYRENLETMGSIFMPQLDVGVEF
jgi:hypothetical protein